MNKKFFAALTSAAMLLSSTGVVLANDFVEVNESGVPGAPEETDFINSTNFPNKNFKAYLLTGGTQADGSTPLSPALTATSTKADLAKVTSLSIPAGTAGAISDLTGLEYFTGLQTLVINTNGNTMESIDLSKNTSLQNLTITATSSATNDTLTSITLPETLSLQSVTVNYNDSLASLDVSGLPALTTLNVNNNDLGNIDVSNNVLLKIADFSNNSLNKLDTSKNVNLTTVTAPNNSLFEVTPASTVATLTLGNNKLEEFDASEYENLTNLDVSNNMLSSLVVPDGLERLNCTGNHLATLDLSNVSGLKTPVNTTPAADGEAWVTGQTVYSNPDNKAVNMGEYDSNFKEKKATATSGTGSIKGTVFTFDNGQTLAEMRTATKVPSYTWLTGNAAIDASAGNPMVVEIVAADLMNRLYNPNSGEHFYTKDINERDTLVKLGWQSEGIGWVAPDKNSLKASAPVFRLYNPNAGDHHYTTSANERDTLVTKGWKAEGIGWYSAEAANTKTSSGTATGALDSSTGHLATSGTQAATIEVLREYNPNAKAAGAHNYTISGIENDALVSLGWLDEGIGWWALK